MELEQRQQIKKYTDLLLRRKRILISFTLLAVTVGLLVYLKMPKVYQSTALIMYQQASINPGSRLSPDVKFKTKEMVSTLSQQVVSRSSLEGLIKQYDLYPKLRQQLPMEDVVDLMRKKIDINPAGNKGGDVYEVSFQGEQPRDVVRVTNSLAARFIEENLRYREEKATETFAYVQDELDTAKINMDKKEAAMRDYKLKFYNEMPQQFQANVGRLTALQTQLQGNRDSGQDLERTKLLIQEQISNRKEILSQLMAQARQIGLETIGPAIGGAGAEAGARMLGVQREYAQLKSTVEGLLSRYTEQHPEVRRAQKRLKDFEQSHPEVVGASSSQDPPLANSDGAVAKEQGTSTDEPQSKQQDEQLAQLELQRKEVDYNIGRLAHEREVLIKQIDQIKKWIEMTPVREAEWSALTRDYDQLNAYYQHLVTRNLEAAALEGLERRQKGSQFKIVDSAYLPERPLTPDFKKIMLMALALGLGLGGGLAFLLELVDPSFKEVAEVERYLQLPVICAIPVLSSPQEKKIKRITTIVWNSVFILYVVALVGAMAYLFKIGKILI